MSNATYMAGVVLTVCIVAAIIITIIVACLSKKVDELKNVVNELRDKYFRLFCKIGHGHSGVRHGVAA